MRGVKGRTYIVTGAASGIGRATARRLVDEGADVLATDVVAESGDEGTAGGTGAAAFEVLDVTDEGAVQGLIDRVGADFGRLWRRSAVVGEPLAEPPPQPPDRVPDVGREPVLRPAGLVLDRPQQVTW